MANLDLAGVIGTWVAAGLAVIALVGIVGPLLVYRASRKERHRAITEVGRNNNSYISPGIPLWPGVRFWQQVRVPRLDKPKAFEDEEWKLFDPSRAHLSNPGPAPSWVQLGASLQAYGVKYTADGNLFVNGGRAYLPVHQFYLHLLCIVGRFSRTKAPRAARVPGMDEVPIILSQQFHTGKNRRIVTADGSLLTSDEAFYRGITAREAKLYGHCGTLQVRPDSLTSTAEGSPYQDARLLSFSTTTLWPEKGQHKDRLSLVTLALLSCGFLPCVGDTYICLIDQPDDDSDVDDESSHPSDRARITYNYEPGLLRRGRRSRRKREAQWRAMELREGRLDIGSLHHLLKDEQLESLAFRTVPSSRSLVAEIEKFAGATFVPPLENWIRARGIDRGEVYVRRSDAQKLARALLMLDWHPQGYVLAGARDDQQMATALLTMAAPSAPPFMLRVREAAADFGWAASERSGFVKAIGEVLKRPESSKALFELDNLLLRLQHENTLVNQMVGVLTITNQEFHSLLYRSTHHLAMSLQSQTEIDTTSGRLKIKGAFNVLQTFEVDMDIFPTSPATMGSQVLNVRHATILVAALIACLRSVMLQTCIEPDAIRELFHEEDEVFLVQ
ncbi:uncharacterized protein AB675_210 [Cyphellophora attinorum]|uniref:Uncharacterized protein n=1 Tax=Cyphellophora attinorum TaxID=1664694 RepID=A0A0N0NK82_9EURO|nr:uncharacterized protein AB675_210 [Phialophora attinorum]KPI37738.1 hypothetical protein AB675_210 [Phialophora attinorum]